MKINTSGVLEKEVEKTGGAAAGAGREIRGDKRGRLLKGRGEREGTERGRDGFCAQICSSPAAIPCSRRVFHENEALGAFSRCHWEDGAAPHSHGPKDQLLQPQRDSGAALAITTALTFSSSISCVPALLTFPTQGFGGKTTPGIPEQAGKASSDHPSTASATTDVSKCHNHTDLNPPRDSRAGHPFP